MLNLNPNQIYPQLKQALNPEQSQSFGRQIYSFEYEDQNYWLKIQQQGISIAHELSFKNELDCYEKIHAMDSSILAPYQRIELDFDHVLMPALVVQHCPVLFLQTSTSLSKLEIKNKLLQSVQVLEKLHQVGYVHGDLKKQHFREHRGQAILIDFEQCFQSNLASVQENTATPRYMAPELFHQCPKTYASDVYALGIIWLEWLTASKLQEKSYLDWAKLHCQHLKIELKIEFKEFEPVLEQLLNRNKSLRCTNFYQIKQQLSQIV